MDEDMDLKGKKVTVVGTGISGIGAAKLLIHADADVLLYDANPDINPQAVQEKLGGIKPRLLTGEMTEAAAEETQLLVISPGVPIDSPLVERFRRQGTPVWGEIELAWHFEKGKVIAITGTNGKTTTTALTGAILGAAVKDTLVVGNIGRSYTGEVLKTNSGSVTVAEISSFQLESIRTFHPVISAILNITPDHLDRHHTMECYAQTKEKICMNEGAGDAVVLNYDDERLREFGSTKSDVRVVWFARKSVPPKGEFAYLKGDEIWLGEDGALTRNYMNVHDMKLIGAHNYENVMAAICMARLWGVADDVIREEIRNFKAVEHRIEYVREKDGVVYYNDSKGTNPDASIKAIEAMNRPTVLIGGGFDKQLAFDDYVEAFGDKVKVLVVLGQTADKLEACAKAHGFENVIHAKDMKECVKICAREAKPGFAVLLSPACASWGMFDNYEQRGRIFKKYVNEL